MRARRIFSLILCLTIIAAVLSADLSRVAAAGGAFDITFDGNGRVATDFEGGVDAAYDVSIQPDREIVVVGSTDSGRGPCALAHYNPNGSLDPTFGGYGDLVRPALDCPIPNAFLP